MKLFARPCIPISSRALSWRLRQASSEDVPRVEVESRMPLRVRSRKAMVYMFATARTIDALEEFAKVSLIFS